MNITSLIVELLQKGQKVEIPEIGTFDSVEQANRFSKEFGLPEPEYSPLDCETLQIDTGE